MPETNRLGRQAAMREKLEFSAMARRIVYWAKKLHRAELRTCNGHSRLNNLTVEFKSVLLAYKGDADAVQQIDVGEAALARIGGVANRQHLRTLL